jgi:hypothetical protein
MTSTCTKGSEAQPSLGYLYTLDWNCDDAWPKIIPEWMAHKVTKVTARRVFCVNDERHWLQRSFSREQLDCMGFATARNGTSELFYTEEGKATQDSLFAMMQRPSPVDAS